MACRRHSIANQRLRPRARHRLSAALVAASVCALPLLAAPAAKGAVTLSVPSDTTFEVGTSFLLPVRVSAITQAQNVTMFRIAFLVNRLVVEVSNSFLPGPLLAGSSPGQVTRIHGTGTDPTLDSVKVQWSGPDPIVGSGTLFFLDCRIRDEVRDQKRVTAHVVPFVKYVTVCHATCRDSATYLPLLNAGVPMAPVQNGTIRVTNSTGALPATVALSLPTDTTLTPGATYRIPVRISRVVESDEVTAFNLSIRYPAEILTVTVSPERSSLGAVPVTRIISDGVLGVAWASAYPIIGSGDLFYLSCTVKPDVPDSTFGEVEIGRLNELPNFLNEGDPPSVAQNGLVRVSRWVAVRDERPRPHLPPISAWPNPFNPRVNLRLNSPCAEAFAGGAIKGMIVNPLGQVVRRWAMPGGGHEALWTWDGLDDAGRPVSSGVYLVVLGSGQQWYRSTITLLR